MTRKVEMDATEEQLNRAFKIFAEDNPAGTISLSNVKKLITDWGPKHGWTTEQGDKLLKDLEAEMRTLGAQFATIQLDDNQQVDEETSVFRYPEYIPLMLASSAPTAGRKTVTGGAFGKALRFEAMTIAPGAITTPETSRSATGSQRVILMGRGGLKGRRRTSFSNHSNRGTYE